MNGQTALEYARSRHGTNGENSDFARSKRQQKALYAIKKKIEQTGMLAKPTKIFKLYQLFQNNISTNLNLSQGVKLAKLIIGINKSRIITDVFENGKDGLLKHEITNKGSYVLVPKNDFDDLAEKAKNIFKNNPPTQEKRVFEISDEPQPIPGQ